MNVCMRIFPPQYEYDQRDKGTIWSRALHHHHQLITGKTGQKSQEPSIYSVYIYTRFIPVHI